MTDSFALAGASSVPTAGIRWGTDKLFAVRTTGGGYLVYFDLGHGHESVLLCFGPVAFSLNA